MLTVTFLLLTVVCGILYWKSYRPVCYALLSSLIVGLFAHFSPLLFPLSSLTLNILWMVGPTCQSFFLAKAHKTNLWPIFGFWVLASSLMIFYPTTITILLYTFLGCNYAIQTAILVKNLIRSWDYEEGLAGIVTLGGVGSLLTVWLFGPLHLLTYLGFYYLVLLLFVLFDQYINRLRQFLFQQI